MLVVAMEVVSVSIRRIHFKYNYSGAAIVI